MSLVSDLFSCTVFRELHVVNTDDLVDPVDEGRYFDVDPGHFLPAAAETPADETSQFEVAFIFTDQRTASITLASIVSGFTTGAETGSGHDEYLFGDGIDLSDAFSFADDGNFSFSHSQRDGSSLSHVAVASDRATPSGLRNGSSGGQADDANARFQFGLPLELEQSDVIVQCLAVVVVVDVRGGNAKSLCSGTSVSAGQIVVTNPNVDSVTRANDVGYAMSCG